MSLDNPYINSRQGKIKIRTDENGCWRGFVDPGVYYLWFLPDSNSSKFEMETSPFISNEHVLQIAVEKGKITKVIKKMERSGEIKVILTDPTGNKIIPREYMNAKVNVDGRLINELLGLIEGEVGMNKVRKSGKLNEGEILLGKLQPGKYSLELSFYNGGYGDIRVENIEVTREIVTEVKVVIDMNDSTGVEGYVKDVSGAPISDYDVKLKYEESLKGNFKTTADGYYRIVGLKPDKYQIEVSYTEDYWSHHTNPEDVEIKAGVMLRKDFVDEDVRVSSGGK